MPSGFLLGAAFWLALLASAIVTPGASAQTGTDIFVTPIPNAPFSGVIHVERLNIRPDGSAIKLKTFRLIGRDSLGRIHNESRILLPDSSNQTPQIVRVHLYDPETRVSTVISPQQRTFWKVTLNRPPATLPPDFFASSTGNRAPSNQFTREEDLGTREISGLPVHGIRQIQTIPAQKSASGKEIVISDEYWYSDDLNVNVAIKHSDTLKGTVTMTLTQITRAEPDPILFQIPGGYTQAAGDAAQP
jgi:hypothetical protein